MKFESKINKWISENETQIINDLKQLIAIPSVAQKAKNPEYPCGTGCARALDFTLSLAKKLGFETRNYGYYCGSAILRGKTDKKIGIFTHIDTAAVTDMWLSDPFQAVCRDGYIIGCGTQDNKGAAISLLHMLRFIKESGCLTHTIELVFGCAKKLFMEDIDYYLASTDIPQFSLVADANFPVCIQEKGSANFMLKCAFEDDYIVDFHAGRDTNAIPDTAFALIKNSNYKTLCEKTKDIPNCSVIPVGSLVKLSIMTNGGHAAFPFDRTSPIPILAKLLLKIGTVNQAKPIMEYLAATYSACDGTPFTLSDDLTPSEATTHICSKVTVSNGVFTQVLNIRYSSVHNSSEVVHKVRHASSENGFECQLISNIDPWIPDAFPTSLSAFLTDLSNKYLGTNLSPFTMGGITYAHKLPNSIAFGPNRVHSDSPSSYGIGHTANEAILINDLMNLIKIYTVTLNEIDEMF